MSLNSMGAEAMEYTPSLTSYTETPKARETYFNKRSSSNTAIVAQQHEGFPEK
jgi:hypothetical protein